MKKKMSRKAFIRNGGLGLAGIPLLLSSDPLKGESVRQKTFNCILTPEEVSGPFNLGPQYLRSDIREGMAGYQLDIRMIVLNAYDCQPVPSAIVNIWQSDAQGIYSAFGEQFGNEGGIKETTYLRGYQKTDENGQVGFTTIFPGWYNGRVAHIHFEVILPESASTFVSQLYFPSELEAKVYKDHPAYLKGQNPYNWQNDFVINGNNRKAEKLLPEINVSTEKIDASFIVGLDI